MPIGPRDVARCSACSTSVPIPASYVVLRTTAARDEEARDQADAISVELTRPPSLAMRFWATAGNVSIVVSGLLLAAWLLVSLVMCIGAFIDAGFVGAIIVLFVGLVLGVPLFYNEALHGLAGPLGTDLADVWSSAGSYALLGLSLYLLVAVPPVLAGYAESFESVRAALRKVLSAPAMIEGGAAQCRTCGAPVYRPAGALHVRCIYCRTDNLVDGSSALLARATKDTEIVCHDLESALFEERRVASTARILVAKRLAKRLVLVPLFVLLGRGVAGVNEDHAMFWRRAARSSPMLPSHDENPLLDRDRQTLFAIHSTFDGCDTTDCWAYYFVALERGDELLVTAEAGDLRLLEIARRHVGRWYDPTYEWRAMERHTQAPYAGWYRVKLATSKQRTAPEPQLVWTVTR